MTNLNKTKEEIIYEIVLSLNKGNSCSIQERVRLAIAQYDDLVSKKIITEETEKTKEKECNHDWTYYSTEPTDHYNENGELYYRTKKFCSKCGVTETKMHIMSI